MKHVVAILISLAFGSAVWVSNGEARTSHHHATRMHISSLVISTRRTTVTELKTRHGCLGAVGAHPRWHVITFPAQQCGKSRTRWIVYGYRGGPYGFESLYLLRTNACPGLAPNLQASRAGRRMTVVCTPMGFGIPRQQFTARTR